MSNECSDYTFSSTHTKCEVAHACYLNVRGEHQESADELRSAKLRAEEAMLVVAKAAKQRSMPIAFGREICSTGVRRIQVLEHATLPESEASVSITMGAL